MLAQITPEWGSFIKESGVIGGIAFLLLYGMYLLINRYLNQQEKDRELLINIILEQIKTGNSACDKQTGALMEIGQLGRDAKAVADRNGERLECIGERLDKVSEDVRNLKGLWK